MTFDLKEAAPIDCCSQSVVRLIYIFGLLSDAYQPYPSEVPRIAVHLKTTTGTYILQIERHLTKMCVQD